ncbi:gamma-soluble NSF attachment protein-like [Acanthaster planci]|uniref:Gamma-soluble NSF attachment protein n=1 Tax=Acanthaster planci TaxID=133434 RepID=A0A8B7XKE8_ACAPL|nr:gamma-soluble NSF attachment protein-like [Acanthaster planci]
MAAAVSAKKTVDAEGHAREAEKCLKTSWTKWKPDFDGAAHAYEKAGLCYRHAKSLEKSKAMYMKAAECHTQCKALFHAAKAYEQAALLLKDMKEYDEAVHLITRAASMFREHGTGDTAAISLEKAAKMMETINAKSAVDLYLSAAEIAENEDRIRQSVDSVSKAARLSVRTRDFDKALQLLEKARNMYDVVENLGYVYKMVVVTVLVHLHRGDFVAASKVCNAAMRYDGYAMDESSSLLEQLLEAYDQQDQESASKILFLPYFTYLDNDYVKLARTLRVPGGEVGGGGGRQELTTEGATAMGGQDEAVEDDEEDEYAGGLC